MAALAEIIPIRADADLLAQFPTLQARIDRQERWRTNDRWGDLGATQLANVLSQASRGDVYDYADLVEYAITTDPDLLSLYTTRVVRVAQADYIIKPNQFGNQQAAELAAEFVNEQLGRLENFQDAMCALLHAIGLGYQPAEMVWDRDASTKTHYVESIVERHAHRFRYDLQWNLRLYDHGRRRGPAEAMGYGEALDPQTFIVHTHKEVAGYPGIAGVMRACIWRWMFARWAEKWRMNYLEKYGSPYIYGVVPKGTPEAARNKFLDVLTDMTAEHAGVIEEGDKIVIEQAGTQAKGDDSFDKYQQFVQRSLAKAWLGASDIVDPGANGSQAAVTTRTSATTDPRMVTDGVRLANTLKRTLFKQLLLRNAHKFQWPIGMIPLPEMKLKTADDEVKTDAGAKATEIADQQHAANAGSGEDVTPYEVQGDPDAMPPNPKEPPPFQPQKVRGNLADWMQKPGWVKVTPGRIALTIKHEGNKWCVYSEAGKKLGEYDTKAEAEERLRQIEYYKQKKAAIVPPKSSAPGSKRGQRQTTSATIGRLAIPIARALRGELDGSEPSPSSPSQTPLKF